MKPENPSYHSVLTVLTLAVICFSSAAFGQNRQGNETDTLAVAKYMYFAPATMSEANQEMLNQVLTLNFDGITVEQALKKIAVKAGLRIQFSKDVTLVNWDAPVHLQMNTTVAGAIYAVLHYAEKYHVRLLVTRHGQLILSQAEDYKQGDDKTESISIVEVQEQYGTLSGRVIDSLTGKPLYGANIILHNTAIGTSSNDEGEFTIVWLPAGDQSIAVRYMGYISRILPLSVIPGETMEKNIFLEPDQLEGDGVTIYTQAFGQARAIRQQLNANTIVNVVSETRFRELPDANAAESIGRLPGVSVIRAAGEGQKVAIRGMGPQYSSITIDGNRVPGTDGDRSFNLSMITPDMLAGIEVYKSIRPDMDADAIGGSVNIRMGEAAGETRFRVNLESGYNNQITGVGNYKGSILGSSRFLKERLGVMAFASAQDVDRSAHIFSSSYTILRDKRPDEPHAPVVVNSLSITDVQSTRQRYGGGLSLDWRLPGGRLFVNNVYSQQNREEIRYQRRYHLESNLQEWLPGRVRRNIFTLNSTLAGEHSFSGLEVEWRLNRSVSAYNVPHQHRGWFREPNALDLAGADLSGGPEIIPTFARNRPDLAYLESLINQESEEQQTNLSASMDIKVPVVMGRHAAGYFKFGGKHYHNYRDRLSTGYRVHSWDVPNLFNNPNSMFPWLVNENGRASMIPFITDPDRRYFILDGQYEIAHMPSIRLIDQIWDNYSDLYRTLYFYRFDDYEATERLTAGYIMAEFTIGSRLMILPGVRYEHEHSEYKAMVGSFQVKPEDIDEYEINHRASDSLSTRNVGMWFPMVQARYRVTDWFDIRAARTVTTSRPHFLDISPRLMIQYDGGIVTRSNTQIKPIRAVNYDLFLTFNHNRFGLVTIGGFYKEVEDLIYIRNARIVYPDKMELPQNTRRFQITEPVNNENLTTVHGLEVEWQSNLTWLPSPFNGLVLNANYSRVFSEAHYHSFEFRRTSEGIVGVDTFRTAPMVHQADHIANMSVGYDYRGFSSRVSMQYQGATLRSIGDRPETDWYTDDYLRFDASIRQRFFGGALSIFANLHNITNREDRTSQFTYDLPRSMEYYGATFDIGLEYRF
ncbi:MAG: TonB-dependent receptor [Balneolaceae bacterium]|nr:MAG: TonB-dependent receptor [Balneolaceae bacterium]